MKKEEKHLHKQFVEYGANARLWMRKCVLLLPEIEKHEIWRKKGFGSIYEYAAKLSGMSRNTVNEGLRVLRKIEDMPALRKVAEVRGINAVKPVVTIATTENEEFWAEKAESMSRLTLETYVREIRKREVGEAKIQPVESFSDGDGFHDDLPGEAKKLEAKKLEGKLEGQSQGQSRNQGQSHKIDITMSLDRKTAEMLQKLKGKGEWSALMNELLELRKKKLEKEEVELVAEVMHEKWTTAKSRYIPAKIRKHVLRKTNEQCAYPGCTKPYAILHHTQRFALERVHDPRRLVPLCRGHEAIAHQGLIDNEAKDTEHWSVQKEPDVGNPCYAIDKIVMEYRRPSI
jgi:hypothetical protein